MKLALQYLNDSDGHTNAVLVSILEWKKLMAKLEKYEVSLHIKKSLETAVREAHMMSKSKKKKQSFSEFLNEL